jgi:putative ABC transport system substrate-binding protein
MGDSPDSPWLNGLWDGLRDLGWVEGQTLAVERQDVGQIALSDSETAAVLAELVALPVDVLVVVGTPATLAAKRATERIPVVFISVADPVGVGLVASLARPGGNLTGVSNGASTQLDAKKLELLKAVVPGLQNVAVINQVAGGGVQSSLAVARLQEAGAAIGVQVQLLDVGMPVDLPSAFASATRWPADAIIVNNSLVPLRTSIADLAARTHLPAMYGVKEFVDAGGLMSYGASAVTLNRHAAIYIDKILRGARPADLPVEQLTTVEFVVNVKTAQALGLNIPPSVAAQVTQWIR